MNKENMDSKNDEDIIDLPIAAGTTNAPTTILDANTYKNPYLSLANKINEDKDAVNQIGPLEIQPSENVDDSFDFLNHVDSKAFPKDERKRKASFGSQYSKGSAGSKKNAPHNPQANNTV